MSSCLILGQAAVGKTSLVRELLSRGLLAYDADDSSRVPGLSGWYDENHQSSEYESDVAWRERHRFLWNLDVVKKLLSERDHEKPLYFAGTSQNDLQALPFFTHVVVLDANLQTYRRRYLTKNQETSYPMEPRIYSGWLRKVLPGLRLAWLAHGFEVIDTSKLSVQEVADRVIAHVET